MARGLFITFEGIEGCGKSTQIQRLHEALVARGYDVLVTREPGGPPVAEKIRAVLLDPENDDLSTAAELLLYAAARAQHVDTWIRPALERGTIVLSDRFADSTTAYQGAGRGLAPEVVAQVHAIATRGTWPDLTVLLDVPADVGMTRVRGRNTLDRIERESQAFHERVRAGFLALAETEPVRIRTVDGTAAAETVAAEVCALVLARLEQS